MLNFSWRLNLIKKQVGLWSTHMYDLTFPYWKPGIFYPFFCKLSTYKDFIIGHKKLALINSLIALAVINEVMIYVYLPQSLRVLNWISRI